MDNTLLGKRLREARIKKGYKRHYMALQADIGEVYLGEIERGLKMPSINIFVKIVEALDVSADYILRDVLPSGCVYTFEEITEKLYGLTPIQRKTAADILDAYVKNL